MACDAQGGLLSAADCHDRGPGQRAYALAKQAAMRRLAAMSDAELNFPDTAAVNRFRDLAQAFQVDALARQSDLAFGVINLPLPWVG